MKKGYRNNILLAAWVSALFLQLQVVKPERTYLRASSGDIKSISYPQNYIYPMDYFHEWQIKAPTGYRIRLKFRDFNLGNCSPNGYILEVWNGIKILNLCGQRIPPTIESSGSEMELYLYSPADNRRVRFWARYEMFDNNEVKTTESPIYPTLKPDLSTGDPDSGDSGESYSTQRLYLLMSMMGCVLLLVLVTIFCGCRRKMRQNRSQRPTPTNDTDNTDLENEDEIWGLNFADPPPRYDEVTRQSVPDVSCITQDPSGESTTTDNEGIDSSGLPSYQEALRLSQQSLDANV